MREVTFISGQSQGSKEAGAILRGLREERGWSLGDFSKLTKSSIAEISKHETGKRKISKIRLLLWLKVLDREDLFDELYKKIQQ